MTFFQPDDKLIHMPVCGADLSSRVLGWKISPQRARLRRRQRQAGYETKAARDTYASFGGISGSTPGVPVKSGARCYGSCLSTVAGAIFNLERGLNVPQDEDITHPEGFFRGMPSWDRVMTLPYQDRIRAFRDSEIRKAMSAEASRAQSRSRAP
jgi:hypothetical protein